MIGPRKRRGDFAQVAHSVVADATGQTPDELEAPEKNPHAVALGRVGGLEGGKARADFFCLERRREIARKARRARHG